MFKGRKTNDLIKMNPRELRLLDSKGMSELLRRLFSTANKRIDRLIKNNKYTLSLREVLDTGGKFKQKGLSLEEKKKEYLRVSRFLSSADSTMAGYKADLRLAEIRINQKLGNIIDKKATKDYISLNDRQMEALTDVIHKMRELPQYKGDEVKYEQTLKSLIEGIKDQQKDVDQLLSEVIEDLNNAYIEKRQKDIAQEKSLRQAILGGAKLGGNE